MRQCGAAAPCADTSKFCDLARGICLPLSGACESVADCPALPSELATYSVGCNAKRVCEVTQALTPFPFGAESALQFVTPTPGQGYADEGALQLVWDQMVAPTFVEIFAHELTSQSDYAAELLWVASWRPGQPAPRWGDGFHVENDEWKKPPNDLPTGVPLFAVALALDGATLKGATPFTPFYIGKSPWRSAGSACGAAADCLNPAAAATCVSGACQLLCMSDVTCPLGHLCTASQAVRTCAP